MDTNPSKNSYYPPAPKVLGVPEAANYLAISETKLRLDMQAGRIPYVRLGRRTVLRSADLDAYLERNLVTAGGAQ